MALMTCPECGKEISDKANSCPNCGYPIERKSEDFSPQGAIDDFSYKSTQSSDKGQKYILNKNGENHYNSNIKPTKAQSQTKYDLYATISFILSFVGILTLAFIIGFCFSVASLVLGIIALINKTVKKVRAIIGVAISGITVCLFIFIVIIVILTGDYNTEVTETVNTNKSRVQSEEKQEKKNNASDSKKSAVQPVPKESSNDSKDSLEPENENKKESEQEDIDSSTLSESDYKSQCLELWHDDVFFSDEDLQGRLVKMDLFIEERRFFKAEATYDPTASDFINKYDLHRDFFKCGVKRSDADSYIGGQLNLYFTNNYDCSPDNYNEGDHLIIYGEIVNYSTFTYDGYNSCSIIPRFIEYK